MSERVTRQAVVSGGGTGIGRAIAERLAADGADVVIVGRRAEVLATAAKEINDALDAQRVTTATADLTSPDDVQRLADDLPGTVDVLVNNAGGNFGDPGDGGVAAVAAAWDANLRGNVLPTVLLTEAVKPLLARPGGRVVTITSIAALRGPGSYAGAKAALNAWSLGLAQDLAAEGITVNVVAPGFVPDTEFWADRLSGEVMASRLAQIPLGRPGTPAEVAAAVAHLAAPDAGWTTGQILQVNGGAMLGRG
jgi:3-oxoacyl-[acyl-carrier protein] reductase